MRNIRIHSVVIAYKTLEILSADTEFYAFMGQGRPYSSFEKLIAEDCRQMFTAAIDSRDTAPLVIDMLTESGRRVMTYMVVIYGKDSFTVELEAVNELRAGQEQYNRLYTMCQDLLGLHNDVIFTCDGKSETVSFYTPDFRRKTRTCSLQEFTDEIRRNIAKEEYDELDKMVKAFSSGSGSFASNFKGKILDSSQECKSSVVKGFVVDDIEGITVVGYIHRASNKSKASYTFEKDALTGTYSKGEIANLARKTIEVDKQKNVAICIIDVDYFKRVNDVFGHLMGDKVLKEIAKIIKTEVGSNGIVGRFGGDEFFVLFYDVENMELYREKLRSIKTMVSTKFPPSKDNSTVSVTLSIGCAVYPKDADNYDDLFWLADYCLYQAKDKGRNRYVIYIPERHGTLEEIKGYFNNNRRIDNRKGMAMGDVLCMIGDMHFGDADYTPEMLVDDLVENLPVERIVCLTGSPLKYRCMSGINLTSTEVINECADKLSGGKLDLFENDVMLVDNIEVLRNSGEEVYEAFRAMQIQSCVLVRFKDAAGKPSLLSLEMTTMTNSWNRNQIYNFRTIARMFAWYEL